MLISYYLHDSTISNTNSNMTGPQLLLFLLLFSVHNLVSPSLSSASSWLTRNRTAKRKDRWYLVIDFIALSMRYRTQRCCLHYINTMIQNDSYYQGGVETPNSHGMQLAGNPTLKTLRSYTRLVAFSQGFCCNVLLLLAFTKNLWKDYQTYVGSQVVQSRIASKLHPDDFEKQAILSSVSDSDHPC